MASTLPFSRFPKELHGIRSFFGEHLEKPPNFVVNLLRRLHRLSDFGPNQVSISGSHTVSRHFNSAFPHAKLLSGLRVS